jgi:3',5'-cyclic AMP phosphodiesterase CpdA
MAVVAQISDLHFGAHEPAVVEALRDALVAIGPDLVVVSGDLTQRARTAQFVAAETFLAALEADGLALLVVPGNHDVPLHKPVTRLLRPLGRYRRIVQRDRPAFVAIADIAVLGLASAHGLTVKDGRLTRAQIRSIGACFRDVPEGVTRLLVTHHPLVPLPGDAAGEIEPALRGARRTLAAVHAAGVHLVLAGHHHAHSVTMAGPTVSADPQILVVQAGTATSHRRRGTPNSFNVIAIDADRLTIAEWTTHGGAPFTCTGRTIYERACPGGWAPRTRNPA